MWGSSKSEHLIELRSKRFRIKIEKDRDFEGIGTKYPLKLDSKQSWGSWGSQKFENMV